MEDTQCTSSCVRREKGKLSALMKEDSSLVKSNWEVWGEYFPHFFV